MTKSRLEAENLGPVSYPGITYNGPTLVLRRGETYEMEANADFAVYDTDRKRFLCSNNSGEINPFDPSPPFTVDGCGLLSAQEPMPSRHNIFTVPRNAPDLMFYSDSSGLVYGYLYIVGKLPYFRYFVPILIMWFGCLCWQLHVFRKEGLTGFGPRWPRRVGYANAQVACMSRAHSVLLAIQMTVEVFVTILSGCFWWIQIPLLFIQLYLLHASVTCTRALAYWCSIITFCTAWYYVVVAFVVAPGMYTAENGYQPTMTENYFICSVIVASLEILSFVFCIFEYRGIRAVVIARRVDYVEPSSVSIDNPPPYAISAASEEHPSQANPPLLIQCPSCFLVQGVLPTHSFVQCSQCFKMLATPWVNAQTPPHPPPNYVSSDPAQTPPRAYQGDGAEACNCCSRLCHRDAYIFYCVVGSVVIAVVVLFGQLAAHSK